MPGAQLIPTFSTGRLLEVARKASQGELTNTDSSLVATLFSAISAEAWLNDLLYRVRTSRSEECIGRLAHLQPLIKASRLEDRTTSTITKYDVIGTVLHGEEWSRGAQPYQDFDLLLDVRNFIVHQKPETTPIDVYSDGEGRLSLVQPKLAGIAERLVARQVVPRPPQGAITPALALVQRSEVGAWAYSTSCQFIAAMVSLLPAGGWRQLALLGMEDLIAPYSLDDREK